MNSKSFFSFFNSENKMFALWFELIINALDGKKIIKLILFLDIF